MKNLNKGLFIGLLLIAGVQTYAQKIGIQGGINLSTLVDKDDNTDYADLLDYENNPGFNAGITLELSLSKLLSVEVGAMVDSKGTKMSEGENYLKLNLLYADVPVLVKVGPSLGPVKVFGAAGPYVGFGLTGKTSLKIAGETTTEVMKWGDGEENDFKRLDYGAKFGIGAEVMGFTIGAYYSMGLANIASETSGGYKEMNRVISVSVGYKFGK